MEQNNEITKLFAYEANDILENFIKQEEVLVASIMLYDENQKNVFIPEDEENESTYRSKKKVKQDVDEFLKSIEKDKLPFINHIILKYSKKNERNNAFLITSNEMKKISIDTEILSKERKIILGKQEKLEFNSTFQGSKDELGKIESSFVKHQEYCKKNKDYFWLFFPINFETLNKSALFYLTILDKEYEKKDLNKFSKLAFDIKRISSELLDREITVLTKHLFSQQLKTAIISILIDSYAHNISAHSLAALKWWIELRYKMMDKRFSVPASLLKLNPHSYFLDADKTRVTTKKYYEALGLTDSSYDEGFYSLYDFLQFADQDTTHRLLSFTEKVKLLGKDNSGEIKEKNKFNPRFPVPIDYALYPFFRFLRDKGAFWSGVTRDVSNGGETKSWYKILWEDFANNPLYLGTIAKSEGITKININLAIKSDKEFYHGRFVTIDLSVIEYEEKLANDPNLELKKEDEKLLHINHKDEKHCSNEECSCNDNHESLNEETNCFQNGDDKFVETESYSKYAFVRLGKCFAHFREILDTEEFTAYLPGGIIGEHALFTIFENQIRNIKHYKDNLKEIKTDGIDFWISIEKDELNLNSEEATTGKKKKHSNRKKATNDKTQLFKVGVWLAHKTDLGNIKTVEGKDNYDDVLIKKVTDSTIQPILDDNGSPRMGGNSQDKACAAMLFNNEFKAVERRNNEKEKTYFPWINFATTFAEKPFDALWIDKGKKERYVDLKEDDDRKNEYANDYLKEIGIEKEPDKKYGYLKKYFYLWQGADYLEVTDVKDLEGENVSRFKFAIVNVDDENKKKEIILRLRRDGVIRILEGILSDGKHEIKKKIEEDVSKEFEKNKNNDEFKNRFVSIEKETNRRVLEYLYQSWLKKWISKDSYTTIFGEHWSAINYSMSNIELKSNPSEISKLDLPIVDDLKVEKFDKTKYHYLPLSHGGIDESIECNIRSHGVFWSKFFEHIKSKQPDDLSGYNYPLNKIQKLYELNEILLTQIIIYDNRIWDRFQRLSQVKREMFEKNLMLKIYDERSADDKFGDYLNEKINDIGLPVVLIMHLSFIESLGFKEDEIDKFVIKYLSKFINVEEHFENFVFVVTTGRGRDAWRSSLEKNITTHSHILKKTIFKPVESLLTAVESGISYNDNFDVKYNLIKVIFGS